VGTRAMAGLSKEEQATKQQQEADKTVSVIGPLVFMIVTGGQLLNQSRPILVNALTGGDTVRTATLLARFAAFGGAAEFLLNPIIGRMSDRFGRRPLLLLSPITCALLRGLVFLSPTKGVIMCERMLSSAVVTGFFSTMRAMLNDKLSMEQLVVAGGAISVYAGVGVMLGPFLETFILSQFGARGNFLAVALINVLVSTVMWRTAQETLPESEQKPINIVDCSPLSFIKMLRTGSVNQRLMAILLLQSFGEIRINQDINMLNLRDNLGWKPIQVSNFMAIIGFSVTTGGKTVRYSLRHLGMRGHTTMSNLVMALAFTIQGTRSKYLSQYGALALWFFGGRKRDAVEAMSSELTLAKTDMGKGQVSAALSNFKSLAAIFGPPIAARAYNFGMRMGNPGIAYDHAPDAPPPQPLAWHPAAAARLPPPPQSPLLQGR
jgi:DHA1 family tetracycline resistance protein-like MFS transporter